jgi:hypothetical protein
MASTTRTGPKGFTKKTTEERAAAAAALRARLEEFERELDPATEGEILARFMGYSARNAKLIAMQAADLGFTATDVAGFHAWRDRGRKVQKRPDGVPSGGWGLKILAPAGSRKRDGKVAVEGEGTDGDKVFFHTVTVFDISQTDPIE